MADYLVAHGIPAAKVVRDFAGRDTYDSCARAKRIFGVEHLTVVTQTYHLPRAVATAFCALLIFTVRPYRVGDYIEVLDTAEKVGAKGRVVDINLLYTTLEDATAPEPGTLLQIPNSLIFQRVVRRWPAGLPLPQAKTHLAVPAATSHTSDSPAAPKPATFP